jgi:hypothetical protein
MPTATGSQQGTSIQHPAYEHILRETTVIEKRKKSPMPVNIGRKED